MLNETLFLNENFKTFGDYTETLKESLEEIFFNEALTLNKNKNDKLIKKFKMDRNRNIAQLNSKGIKVNRMLAYSDKVGKELAIKIKKEKFSKAGAKNIAKYTSEAIGDIKRNAIDEITEQLKDFITDASGGDEYIGAFILLGIVLCVNTMFNILFTILFGPLGGIALTSIIIAPITEEIAKLVSVRFEKDRSGSIYNVVFNMTEFMMYFSRMYEAGVSIPVAIGIRIPAVIMHSVNTWLISSGFKSDVKNGRSEDTAGSIATILTMCIHSIFNAIAVTVSIS